MKTPPVGGKYPPELVIGLQGGDVSVEAERDYPENYNEGSLGVA